MEARSLCTDLESSDDRHSKALLRKIARENRVSALYLAGAERTRPSKDFDTMSLVAECDILKML